MFKLEQELYRQEHISWAEVVFVDNQECLDLIEGRSPPGRYLPCRTLVHPSRPAPYQSHPRLDHAQIGAVLCHAS